ncbi:MAG: hypothetical protein WB500_01135 [Rhodoplanes sp.]
MISDSICTTRLQPEAGTDEHLFDSWFDPIERARRGAPALWAAGEGRR